MRKKQVRIQQIIDTLKLDDAVTIKELSRRLGVSEMTIRRDLGELAQENQVKLLHGAAIYNRNRNRNGSDVRELEVSYHLPTETKRMTAAKERIAEEAAKLIEPNDIIHLDSGTTTEYLARCLPENANITVLCYSLNVLLQVYMKKGFRIIFPGGYYHEHTLVFESPEAVDLINRNRIQKAFFAAGGVSETLGVTCSSPYVVSNKQAVLGASLTKILLVDSSKFGTVKESHYADLQDFDIVITDSSVPQPFREILADLGIQLIVA